MMEHCQNCAKPLEKDEIAVSKKLINRGATSFFCISCLARRFEVTESDIIERIAYFRSSGCTLFESPENNPI